MKWNQNKRSLTLLFEIVAFVVVISLGFAGCDTSTTPANYTVTFDTGGGGAIAPVTVDAGSTVNRPTNPTRTGYSFDNWYTAATGGSVVSWPLTVSGDITVYARWTEESTPASRFTVTFDAGGGSSIAPVTVDIGSTVNKPANPTRTGYSFDNWYTAAIGGSVISWPLTVSENITVYARWILVGQGSIKVSFSGLPQDETTSLMGTSGTLSWTRGTLNLSVPSVNFLEAYCQWYLDGSPLNGETGYSLNKPGSDFTLGQHAVAVQIQTADHTVYSKSVRFTVEQ